MAETNLFPITGDVKNEGFCTDPQGIAGFPCVLPIGHDPLSSLPHQSSDQGWNGKTRHSESVGSSQSLRLRSTSSSF